MDHSEFASHGNEPPLAPEEPATNDELLADLAKSAGEFHGIALFDLRVSFGGDTAGSALRRAADWVEAAEARGESWVVLDLALKEDQGTYPPYRVALRVTR
ncbi:hypothetical protein [Streptomyces cinereoruber]|uniref:hypothetical protein n=1 Tax=Streptomyces cinereoruber TaxID=67260 RepID=UPI003C2DA07F